jgi:hypothetical protein
VFEKDSLVYVEAKKSGGSLSGKSPGVGGSSNSNSSSNSNKGSNNEKGSKNEGFSGGKSFSGGSKNAVSNGKLGGGGSKSLNTGGTLNSGSKTVTVSGSKNSSKNLNSGNKIGGTITSTGVALNGNSFANTVSICGGNCTEYTYTEYNSAGAVVASRTRIERSESGRSSGGINKLTPKSSYTGTMPPDPCVDLPDLDIVQIDFSNSAGLAVNVLGNLDGTVTYTPEILVRNIGCVSTHGILILDTNGVAVSWYPEGTDLTKSFIGGYKPQSIDEYIKINNYSTSTVFNEGLPYGAEGMFPVSMRVDFGNNGFDPATDWEEYVYMVPALFQDTGARVIMPDIKFPIGTHRIDVIVDQSASADPNGFGCSQPEGCIRELPVDNNSFSLTINVIEPRVGLDVFYYNELDPWGDPKKAKGARVLGDNDIATDWVPYSKAPTDPLRDDGLFLIGLHWTMNVNPPGLSRAIQPQTCTGSSFDEFGNNLNEFNGQSTRSVAAYGYILGRGEFDESISKPPVGSYYVYTISCDTIHGGRVSNVLSVLNSTTSPILVDLNPLVSDVDLMVGDVLNDSNFDFNIANNSSPAPGSTYTITIDGGAPVNGTVDVPGVGVVPVNGTGLNWVATTPGTYTLEVCVDHPNQIGTSPKCDTALIRVSDVPITPPTGGPTSGPTGGPIITAVPNPARQNSQVEITWDPIGFSNCMLSSNVTGDATIPGSTTVTALRTTRFTITCDGGSGEETLRVIPLQFET